MKASLTDMPEQSTGHRLGIPLEAEITSDGFDVWPEELNHFGRAEAHLRDALGARGYALQPLGYIQDGCAQYMIVGLDIEGLKVDVTDGASIEAEFQDIVDRARRADASNTTPLCTDSKSTDASVKVDVDPMGGTPSPQACSPNKIESGTRSNISPASIGVEAPGGTPTLADAEDTKRFHQLVLLGPPFITIDGQPMEWSKALKPKPKATPKAEQKWTLKGNEQHIVSSHGSRIRPPNPPDPNVIHKGTTIEMGDVRKEHVLVAEISNQLPLNLDGKD